MNALCYSLPIALLLLTAPAAGQQKRAKPVLPSMMIGVWGETAESCQGAPGERDDRVEVAQDGVGTFVSHYGVRNWQRQGQIFSGRATLAEEGEGKPTPGKHHVALTLLADGKLEVRLNRGARSLYVKCPAEASVR